MACTAVCWCYTFALVIFTQPLSALSSQNTTTSIPTLSPSPTSTVTLTSSILPTVPTLSPSPTSTVTLTSSILPTEPVAKTFNVTVKVNKTYVPAYANLSSIDSRIFIHNFTEGVKVVLSERLTYIKRVEVKNLWNGSVVVVFVVEVSNESSNATTGTIERALREANSAGALGFQLLGNITVTEVQQSTADTSIVPSTSTVPPTQSIVPSSTAITTVPSSTSVSPQLSSAPPSSSPKPTNIWDKAVDWATPMGTFIIVIVAVALVLILLISLICVGYKYRRLKKQSRFSGHMTIHDSEWIRSSDDLNMWERNLRASEVKTNNGISNRTFNEKRD